MTTTQMLLRILTDEVMALGGRVEEAGPGVYLVIAPEGRVWTVSNLPSLTFSTEQATRGRIRRAVHLALEKIRAGLV
jgi:hypothetical protein